MRIEDCALIGDLQSAALVGRDGSPAVARRLLELRNDLDLMAEEYDVSRRRQVGNFPQAFSHLALIAAGNAISTAGHDGGSEAHAATAHAAAGSR